MLLLTQTNRSKYKLKIFGNSKTGGKKFFRSERFEACREIEKLTRRQISLKDFLFGIDCYKNLLRIFLYVITISFRAYLAVRDLDKVDEAR